MLTETTSNGNYYKRTDLKHISLYMDYYAVLQKTVDR